MTNAVAVAIELSGGPCLTVQMMAVEDSAHQLIVGGLIGALFAGGLLSLFVYARRDAERFKKLIVSFVLNEAHLHAQTVCCV